VCEDYFILATLDSLLKYLSLIALAGAAISFVVGLIKYIDQRSLEQRTKRFELFHDLMRRVSAQGDKPNEGLPLSQQAAAIYELQHFPEYAYASVPILSALRQYFEQGNAHSLLLQAIDETLEFLSTKKSKRVQTKT
jgi:hypothetical protein